MEKQPPLSLFSQVCEQAACQEGPLLPGCRLLADARPLQPSCPGPSPPIHARNQPWGLEGHQAELALRGPQGLSG